MNAANNHTARPRVRKAPIGRQAPWALPAISRAQVSIVPAPDADDLVPKHLTIMEIDSTTCKFPYGHSNFTYCGHTPAAGSVYCMAHHLMSYNPVPVRMR